MKNIDDGHQILLSLYDKGLESERAARPNKRRMKNALAFREKEAYKIKMETASCTCLM